MGVVVWSCSVCDCVLGGNISPKADGGIYVQVPAQTPGKEGGKDQHRCTSDSWAFDDHAATNVTNSSGVQQGADGKAFGGPPKSGRVPSGRVFKFGSRASRTTRGRPGRGPSRQQYVKGPLGGSFGLSVLPEDGAGDFDEEDESSEAASAASAASVSAKPRQASPGADAWTVGKLVAKEELTTGGMWTFHFLIADETWVRQHMAQLIPEFYVDLQLITGAPSDGEPIVRSYTPVEFDTESRRLTLCIKLYPNGKMSRQLESLSVGGSVVVSRPKQQLTMALQPTEDASQMALLVRQAAGASQHLREVFLISAGSGITPMLQILRYCLRVKRLVCKFTFATANRSTAEIPFRSALQTLHTKHPTTLRPAVHFVSPSSQQKEDGKSPIKIEHEQKDVVVPKRMTVALLQHHAPTLFAAVKGHPTSSVAVFLCGPPSFNTAIRTDLAKAGIAGSAADPSPFIVEVLE